MNRFNKFLMITFSLAFLMYACKGDDVDPVKEKEAPYFDYKSATDFWFPKEGGDTTIAVVDVNRAYHAKVAEGGEWCTVTDIAVNSFVINYAANKTAADRTTVITLSMEGVDDINIVVSQVGSLPALVLDTAKYKEVTSPYLGVDTIIPIATNGVYKVEIDEASRAWCRVAEMTDINYEFGTTSSTVQHFFTLNIDQNSGLDERSATIAVSLTYQDSTIHYEFVVKQAPTPILLVTPEAEEVIEKATGFPYKFSWKKTGGLSGYSISVSTNSSFPEDKTKVITVGDVDSHTVNINDITEVFNGHYKVQLYWKVGPSDPAISIATETKTFYVQRRLLASYPLELNGASSWIGTGTDEEGYFYWSVNAGQSSRRTWISTSGLKEAIEGKVFAVAYEYKATNKSTSYEYDYFDIYHYAGDYDGNWTIDGPAIQCYYTNEWTLMRAPLTTNRAWGAEGSVTTMFIRPPVLDNNIAGMRYHVKDFRAEVYEE
jgi:hypothetical protein